MQFATSNTNSKTEITNTSDDGRKKAKQYENLATIGQGAFGVAILVRRVLDGLTLVIKKVKVGMMSEKERTDALQEVSILSKLQHPHVIAYHEAFLSEGLLNIVLDYADGGTLEDQIKTAKKNNCQYFPVDTIQCWFTQLAMGLGYVHENKIVHRDVKTANIFLTSQNMIKIGDFGIAKVLSSTADMAQTVVGTPYYLSPELCENRPYNSKSDVWALGCVLYELIMLEHAFKGGNMAALILNIIRGGYDPLPNDTNRCSPSLKSMVDKMLQRDFNNRPSTKEILSTEMVQGEMDKMGITPPTPVRRKRIDQKLGNNNNNNNNNLELMVESDNSDEDDEEIAPPSYSPPPPPQQQQQQIVRNNHHNNALQEQQEESQLTPERSAAAVREMMRRKLREQRNAKNDDPELSRSTNIRKRLEGNKKAFQREAIRKGLQVLKSRGNSRNNTPQQNTNNINASNNNISFSSPQLFLNLKSPSPVHNSNVQKEEEQQLQQENVPTYEARLSLGLGLASVDENNQKNTMEIDDDEDVPTFNVRFSSGYGGRHSPRFSTGGQL